MSISLWTPLKEYLETAVRHVVYDRPVKKHGCPDYTPQALELFRALPELQGD